MIWPFAFVAIHIYILHKKGRYFYRPVYQTKVFSLDLDFSHLKARQTTLCKLPRSVSSVPVPHCNIASGFRNELGINWPIRCGRGESKKLTPTVLHRIDNAVYLLIISCFTHNLKNRFCQVVEYFHSFL